MSLIERPGGVEAGERPQSGRADPVRVGVLERRAYQPQADPAAA
nr:hypothetical protein [Leucobacter komagatae]